MSSSLLLKVEGLTKTFQLEHVDETAPTGPLGLGRRPKRTAYTAVNGVSFEGRRGEAIGILGRNGSGKSTLLQMIAGVLQPTAGSVAAEGRIAALLELGAGFSPEFSGRENVFVAGMALGLTEREVAARFDAIAEFADIGDFIDQPVKLYSSGMFARLAFSVVAHVDADILIVDEALSVGDRAFVQKCMRFIRRFRDQGLLIFVSHDAAAVTSLCERALWLERGYVRMEGDAAEVTQAYVASAEEERTGSDFKIGGERKRPPAAVSVPPDHRAALLRASDRSNVVRVFDFDPTAPWHGARGATIEDVSLRDEHGRAVIALTGGEEVTLHITGSAHVDIESLIVGFYFRDRRGQELFGDNTYITYLDDCPRVAAGDRFVAEFQFRLPYLPTGDYSINVAVAEGSQEDHRQHHWVDDALFVRVESSHVARGLVGVPMHRIALSAERSRNGLPSSGVAADLLGMGSRVVTEDEAGEKR